MTYSTTLPPGFTTWNELWNSHKLIKGEQYCSLFISINQWEKYETKEIKARAFDEIIEFLSKVSIEDKFSLQNAYILEALEELTGINLSNNKL